MSRSSGTVNYELVDEVTADDDTTYVYTNARLVDGGAADTYAAADHASETGTINSLTVYVRAMRTGATGAVIPTVRVGTTTYTSAWQTIASSYANYSYVRTANPATSSAWTWSDIDTMQIGVSAYGAAASQARVTQVWAVVDYTEGGGAGGQPMQLRGLGVPGLRQWQPGRR